MSIFGTDKDAEACKQLGCESKQIFYMAIFVDTWTGGDSLGDALLRKAEDEDGYVDAFDLREVVENEIDDMMTHVYLPDGHRLVGVWDAENKTGKQFGIVDFSALGAA